MIALPTYDAWKLATPDYLERPSCELCEDEGCDSCEPDYCDGCGAVRCVCDRLYDERCDR